MAFVLRDFQPVGATARAGLNPDNTIGVNSVSVWQYGSADVLATVATAGYFNEIRDLVNEGDMILMTLVGGVLRSTFFTAAAKSPSSADVTISSLGNSAA